MTHVLQVSACSFVRYITNMKDDDIQIWLQTKSCTFAQLSQGYELINYHRKVNAVQVQDGHSSEKPEKMFSYANIVLYLIGIS